MYKINIYNNITEAEFWKQNFSPSIFEKHYFLQSTVKSNPDIEYFFAEVSLKNELVGKLLIQTLPFKGSELKSYISDDSPCIVKATIDTVLDKINWKMAVIGNLFVSGDNGQFWHKNLTDIEKWKILKQLGKQLKKDEKVDTILLTEIMEPELLESKIITNDGFKLFEIEPELSLDIPKNWNSFQDYLNDLKSKYRVRTKKVFEKSSAMSVVSFTAENIEKHKQEIHQLYKNVTQKIGFKLAEVSEDYFFTMKDSLGDDFTFSAYMLNNQIIGFITTINNHKHLDVHLIGLNYELNKDNCLYQRILYDCIKEAIDKKMEKVNFGKTAGTIKTSVGAKTNKVYAFLKHNSIVSNIGIKPLFHFLKPQEIETRNPFKV